MNATWLFHWSARAVAIDHIYWEEVYDPRCDGVYGVA